MIASRQPVAPVRPRWRCVVVNDGIVGRACPDSATPGARRVQANCAIVQCAGVRAAAVTSRRVTGDQAINQERVNCPATEAAPIVAYEAVGQGGAVSAAP